MIIQNTQLKPLMLALVLFILVITSSLPVSSTPYCSSTVLVVNHSNTEGPWIGSWEHPFQSIHDAITNATGKEEIYICPGTYNEQLIIDKPLTLIGLNNPIIHGTYNNSIITVTSNDVSIKQILCCYSGGHNNDAGIKINAKNNITISDLIIHHTRNGIIVNNSSSIILINNTFTNNGNGIYCTQSNNITIKQNHFSHNAIAIATKETSFLSLNASAFIGNGMSGLFSNSQDLSISTCNLSDNSVNKGGFFFELSTNCHIDSCRFFHNGDGISMSSSKNITITHSEFRKQTHFGLSLRTGNKDITISDCIISDNKRIGIYIEEDNTIQIHHCNIYNSYLSDISGERFNCDATINWWGSPLGPIKHTNDIIPFLFSVKSIPWTIQQFENVGAPLTLLPPCNDISYEPDYEITFDGFDSDEDCIPDWWEEKWGYSPTKWDDHKNLDPDEDALTNIQECYTDTYGSNPFKKDIFLEIDWMKSDHPTKNKPSDDLIQQMIDTFNKHNITLHIDLGTLGGGSEIPEQCLKPSRYLELHNIYWTYFLNNSMQNPRKGIFHYGIICNYCADLNFPFIGWDSFDSFAISSEWLEETLPIVNRETIISYATLHQLGHTLGIIADDHFGIDNIKTVQPFSKEWITYLPYKSCMNYHYKYSILSFSDGSNGPHDFNDWDNMEFDFFQQSSFSEIDD